MKKFISFLLIVLWCSSLFGASAEVVTYKNVITEKTSIEEDFKVLGMDIENYYIPGKYNFSKFYVIAMSEAYLGENIQTYFYIYNPTKDRQVEINCLEYSLNGADSVFFLNYKEAASSRGLYKVKGFSYSYLQTSEIRIKTIKGASTTIESSDIFNDPPENRTELSSESGFIARIKHTCEDNSFQIELNFNSALILEEYIIKSITIPKESEFWKELGDLLLLGSGAGKRTTLVFYNFNFPDSIQPDEILKAVFSYDLVSYRGVVNNDEPGGAWATIDGDEYAREEIRPKQNLNGEYNDEDLGVYIPGTHTYKASTFSKELSFEIFVLGNRVTKGEFGYVDMSSFKKDFDYDCSILLGNTTIDCVHPNIDGSAKTFQKFENVEFIELHYKKDGIVYRCQIVSKPIDEPPSETPPAKDPWYVVLWKFMVKIGEVVIKFFGQTAPELVCGGLGAFLCFVGIIFSPGIIAFSIWVIIKLLKLPFKIVEKIIGG